MPKVTLWVPEPLHQELQRLPAEVNLSRMFQERLRAVIEQPDGCTHAVARCCACGHLVGDVPEAAQPAA